MRLIFLNKRKKIRIILLCLITLMIVLTHILTPKIQRTVLQSDDYIKWVDFSISSEAMVRAMQYDIDSYGTMPKINWIEVLAYLGAKYGGNFSRYRAKDMDYLISELKSGKTIDDLTDSMSHYGYYKEAYSAVLEAYVGEHQVEVFDENSPNKKKFETRYGLQAFSPIAKGFYFRHYDDFGNSRSYGFNRKHLGNDLIASIGTPVIAVESGIIEALGWNQYGGWRIGIRSFDGRRYYYYAHLRKNYPYHKSLFEGKVVKAGDVIGYVGRSGYSTTENVNNIQTPHLHFGIQLIFDESQKEGNNEIWINVYHVVDLLQKNRSEVIKDEETNEYNRLYDIKIVPSLID